MWTISWLARKPSLRRGRGEDFARSGIHSTKMGVETTTLQENSETTVLITLDAETDSKTLGLLWNPTLDTLKFHANTPNTRRVTKWTILSQLARIFDLLGLVAPVIVTAKLLMQAMWQLELSWDESAPQHVLMEFHNFQFDISSLSQLSISSEYQSISRWVSTRVKIHRFCNASEKAYGACIYLSTTSPSKEVEVRFLYSKWRVNPLAYVDVTYTSSFAKSLKKITCEVRSP